jgi:hypothetical protein
MAPLPGNPLSVSIAQSAGSPATGRADNSKTQGPEAGQESISNVMLKI